MRRRKRGWGGLVFLFTLSVFVALLITIGIFSGILVVLAETGKLSDINSAAKAFPLVISGMSSLALGTLFSFFIVRIPLRPVQKLIDGMKRLANGHFEERIDLGEIAVFQELSESFNALASELECTEMLRTDFINNFSHEFKTPIVSIRGFAKILQRGNLDENERQEYLGIIVDESTRLSNMANNVLNLTKIENQSILSNVTKYNLSEQIRKCVLMMEKKWSEKGLIVSADFSEHCIEGNYELLNQVWINLLDNAIKFSPEDREVKVSVNGSEHGVLVSVCNHGPEIPPEHRKRIFEKFWQADTSHASEGAGIGLSIVEKIVELHHGRVDVTSFPDETVFSVFLPAKPSDEE